MFPPKALDHASSHPVVAAIRVGVTLGVMFERGGDELCAVVLQLAVAAQHLYDARNSYPYFSITVYRHNRGLGRFDTCDNLLQVNGDVEKFETIRFGVTLCFGER